MDETAPPEEGTIDNQVTLVKATLLNRIVARTVDFIIVVALMEIIPRVGYFAGLAYLLLADGLFQGRSLGKRLIGLRVVVQGSDDSVIECSFKESVYRNFPFALGYILLGILGAVPLLGWILSFIGVAVVLVFESLVMLGSENDMRLGDEFAKTQVVNDKQGGLNVS
jgi:uncharacterized RDD family membrane protein YckC